MHINIIALEKNTQEQEDENQQKNDKDDKYINLVKAQKVFEAIIKELNENRNFPTYDTVWKDSQEIGITLNEFRGIVSFLYGKKIVHKGYDGLGILPWNNNDIIIINFFSEYISKTEEEEKDILGIKISNSVAVRGQ
jgi:hypothetical protein